MRKRILNFILCLCMVFSTVAGIAFTVSAAIPGSELGKNSDGKSGYNDETTGSGDVSQDIVGSAYRFVPRC